MAYVGENLDLDDVCKYMPKAVFYEVVLCTGELVCNRTKK